MAASRVEPELAARLLGAAEALCEQLGLSLDPFERSVHGRTLAQAQAHLGDEQFAEASGEGRMLSFDAASIFALGEAEQVSV